MARMPPVHRRTVIADAVTTWCAAREQAEADGYILPPDPPAPGRRVSIPAFGKPPGNRSASAWLSPDCEIVAVKDWTADPERPLIYRVDRPDVRTLSERRQSAQADRERREKASAARANRHRLGTLAARTAWLAATPCTDHPYMRSKGEMLPGCRVDAAGWLLVPRTDIDGNLIGLQRIDAAGGKRYWPGAPTTGTLYLLGRITDEGIVIVAEGAATGATLHRETGHAVACAMDAGNLLTVCEALRVRYPSADIVVAADDDRGTAGNPGRAKAIEAVQAVNGRVWLPELCRCCDCTDHNDRAACARRRGGA